MNWLVGGDWIVWGAVNWALEELRLVVVGSGLLLAVFTARPAIFALLHLARVPKSTLIALDPMEQAAGRIIGYLERLLCFCFVLDGADNAIAMLITAKGIFRIRELGVGKKVGPDDAEAERRADEKTFYIMVGTFASITYAILIAFATRHLFGILTKL